MLEDQGPTPAPHARPAIPRRDPRRRAVRQLLFVVAGTHTGRVHWLSDPPLRIPGDVFSVLLIGVLFALPFLVDASRERIETTYEGLSGNRS